ncbi:proton-coupled zinc antiporter SLC30A2 isoform X2 [Procambarus clarkii]|uniref:proton-coupled zinc antiporter SLC30A2 isoform X2 n=1 Tax=Procambarus clarkii TaxID=6728 RepID=UPI001E672A40|nr:zinc transporter 2-like isoform X2 [Procambarus clarkii]
MDSVSIGGDSTRIMVTNELVDPAFVPGEDEPTYLHDGSAAVQEPREYDEVVPSCNGHYDGEPDGNEVEGGQRSLPSSNNSDHCHAPRLGSRASRQAMKKLFVACGLTTIFMIAEAVGGYMANSIAIMSDAAHLLSDLTSFIVSLVAIYLAMQPASKKMNFGYHRAEVLGAVISVLIIWVITGILVYAAIQRVISMEFEVEADTMIIVSALGVVINIILGVVLHVGGGEHGHSHGGRSHGHSHGGQNHSSRSGGNSTPAEQNAPSSTNVNVRAAFIHVLGDLIQSVGVLIAAYIIRFYPQYKIADPICTFLFSILVMITTIPILKDLGTVLMEGMPPGIDYAQVCSNLTALPGVKMVHSLHVWALTLDKNACSVHLAISPGSDPEVVLRDAQRVIRTRHHIFHTTIQVEQYQPQLMDNCQQCQPLSR